MFHFVHESQCSCQCFGPARVLTACSFKNTGDSVAALKNVQWVYLGIAIFVFLLAFVFFMSHIPEVTDADMEFQVQETHVGGSEKPFWKQYRLFHAAFAQFCYTGAQASYFINYAVDTRPGTSSATGAKLLAGAQGAFAFGRFSGTFLMKFVKPRYVFLAYLTGVVAFVGAASGARQNAGIGTLSVPCVVNMPTLTEILQQCYT
ncbi:hypothetical protein LTR96_007805 [Exophiala xenobiotica]|nr:hypothetical protein LTR96_007805 [Exophiala xenobiotica]KAK5370974.1 hypothetical protein LTS03_007338 [Exophiala xenobiotica]KAK5554986.1 hypothetical protein LTR46_007190 [Exophiala xenobiotica]